MFLADNHLFAKYFKNSLIIMWEFSTLTHFLTVFFTSFFLTFYLVMSFAAITYCDLFYIVHNQNSAT